MLLLVAFVLIENRVPEPMINMKLFKIRAFAAGNIVEPAGLDARGGLQFILIIWLQGIWLPLHGYSFEPDTALGRHLHAAADRRVPGRRPDLRAPVRPVRGPRASPPAELLIQAASFLGLMLIPAELLLPDVRRCCWPSTASARA